MVNPAGVLAVFLLCVVVAVILVVGWIRDLRQEVSDLRERVERLESQREAPEE